ISTPFHTLTPAIHPAPGQDPTEFFDQRLHAAADRWDALTSKVRLRLPPSAAAVSDTFRAMQAYILINRDGPAIQPGSRPYERSWIRDGSMTSAALLATGHTDEARQFIDWYAQRQYDNGRVPCVVDSRGPDPVPEHDSTGQYIDAVANVYRFTHDREF